ncbi:MAG TPA: sigma-70 family RNA polymerase sigma factor [Verrucomicrobiae bacterium]|jgi:RNA polymerase sigma factor (sigma-70 family)
MTDAPDAHLLDEFVRNGSEEAFATLVQRHIGLVHSAALRHVAKPEQARDITQAVFIILARKAGSLGHRTILPGWLYQTVRLVSANWQRAEMRRVRREQEVFMQSTLEESAHDALWPELRPQLDEAMSALGALERDAIVLRYFQNKSMAEVGQLLGLAENTAQKRVGRALEKMRTFFAKRGVDSTAASIAEAISGHSVQSVSPALAQTVTTAALAKGAAASLSSLTLVKTTLIAMKTKTMVAVTTVAAVILGSSTYLIYYLATAHVHPPTPRGPVKYTDSVPVQFNNVSFAPDGNRDGTFTVEVDADTLRTTNSAAAIHIKGPITQDPLIAAQTAGANGTYKRTDNSSSTKYYVTDSSILYGKHVRLTGWIKTKSVQGWVGAFMIIMGMDGQKRQYDDMSDRPIQGTTDWQEVELVTDLPNEPCIIYFGPDLYGPGELWADDFQISLADADEPDTDERNWRIAREPDAAFYSEATDYTVTRNGNPTACLTYTAKGAASRNVSTRFAHDFYGDESDKYAGHTVRMSGWVKTENVSGRVEPVILPYAGWYKLLARDSMAGMNSLTGTRDWVPFAVTCNVPADTEYLCTGFNFSGSGKVWVDTNSIKWEIVK